MNVSNSCKQTPTLSNTAEIVKNIGRGKNTPLQWSKSTSTFVLIPHSAVLSEIYKKISL